MTEAANFCGGMQCEVPTDNKTAMWGEHVSYSTCWSSVMPQKHMLTDRYLPLVEIALPICSSYDAHTPGLQRYM